MQPSFTVYQTLIAILLLLTSPLDAFAELPQDKTSAVILAYHRIGEDAHPDSNLRLEQFREHIDEIIRAEYNVIPLPSLISALRNETPLPEKTIAITFEGGFRSAYENAIPLLLENNLPFTVFFSSGLTERETHLGWDDLKALSKNNNVTLGILPATYTHITHLPSAEQARLINKARADYAQNLGHEARYFAYPFGEVSNVLKDIVKTQNFDAAFGLQSGPAHSGAELTALPRFTMTESHGDLGRFRMVTRALPLPVNDIEPQDFYISGTPSSLGFTLNEGLKDKAISCFISGQDKPTIERIENRVELRPNADFEQGKTRINCTIPGPKDENDTPRWRWFGMILHQKDTNQPGELQ